MVRFVFLDRDGTLVRDDGYTWRIDDYVLLPGVVDGLRRLAAGGYRFAIVTNQSGIGRGYYTADDFDRFQRHLLDDLAGAGVAVERTFHCPHLPELRCACRKPEPGMLWEARDRLGADLGASWVIGDSWRDVQLARAAGCRGAVLVGAEAAADPRAAGALLADGFAEAAAAILAADQAV